MTYLQAYVQDPKAFAFVDLSGTTIMASVIDIISQGVATPELNKALLALTSIFGEK